MNSDQAPSAADRGSGLSDQLGPACYRVNIMEGTKAAPLWRYVDEPWAHFESTALYDQACLEAAVAAERAEIVADIKGLCNLTRKLESFFPDNSDAFYLRRLLKHCNEVYGA